MALKKEKKSSTREALKEKTGDLYRTTILEAAETVLSQKGYAASTMNMVAGAAGLATGTLYNYFDNKGQLFFSLLELRGQELLVGQAAIISEGGTVLERLTRLVQFTLVYCQEHRALLILFASAECFPDKSLQCSFLKKAPLFREQYLSIYRGLVRCAVEDGLFARHLAEDDQALFVASVMDGFTRNWLFTHSQDDLTAKAPVVLRLIINGLKG